MLLSTFFLLSVASSAAAKPKVQLPTDVRNTVISAADYLPEEHYNNLIARAPGTPIWGPDTSSSSILYSGHDCYTDGASAGGLLRDASYSMSANTASPQTCFDHCRAQYPTRFPAASSVNQGSVFPYAGIEGKCVLSYSCSGSIVYANSSISMCYCGTFISTSGTKVSGTSGSFTLSCNISCIGAGATGYFCGGSAAGVTYMALYHISTSGTAIYLPGSSSYTYIACYDDNHGPGQTRILKGTGSSISMAFFNVEDCLSYCGASNYKYAGVEGTK